MRRTPSAHSKHRRPRRISLYARHPPRHVPRQALDHAPVFGLCHSGRDKRALPLFAEPRPNRVISVAFDLPTLMGYDADHAMAEGEVGKCGVSVCSLADMETLLHGVDLSKVSVSMTINSPAAIIWAMFLVAAERQGVRWDKFLARCKMTF